MKRYLKSPGIQILIILLISILMCEILFLIIRNDFDKFLETTYQSLVAVLSIIGAFIVSREIENNKNLQNIKKSEILIMNLLEDELQQNIDIFNNQYKNEVEKEGSLIVYNMEQFILDKWASIQISLIQVKDLFYDKDLYEQIIMLHIYFNRINYLIKNKKVLGVKEKKMILGSMQHLIWEVFDEIRKYNNKACTLTET